MASRAGRHAGVVLTLLLSAGCAADWSPPWGKASQEGAEDSRAAEPAPPAADTAAPEAAEAAAADSAESPDMAAQLSAFDRSEVEFLLSQAEWAIRDDHLTFPARDSALDLYERVRLIDPDNDAARRGLERIVERYLELAMIAADQRRFSQADGLLDRARLVDPDHPGLEPTAARIGMQAEADRQVIPLDSQRLRARDPDLTDSLRQAGLASRGDGCRARITARSDEEGRWIYQQMSQRGQARIQAQLDIGSPPRVEVMCFPDQAP